MQLVCYFLAFLLSGAAFTHLHAETGPARVYGSPGKGRIPVQVQGDFQHPGTYWVPADTKLAHLLEEAKPTRARKDEPGTVEFIRITRKHDGQPNEIKAWLTDLALRSREFKLERDDIVGTSYLAL